MLCCVFFQAEDGIRDLVRSRGLGDVYKRQGVAMEPIVNPLFLSKEAGPNPLARVVTGVVAAGLSLNLLIKDK